MSRTASAKQDQAVAGTEGQSPDAMSEEEVLERAAAILALGALRLARAQMRVEDERRRREEDAA